MSELMIDFPLNKCVWLFSKSVDCVEYFQTQNRYARIEERALVSRFCNIVTRLIHHSRSNLDNTSAAHFV